MNLKKVLSYFGALLLWQIVLPTAVFAQNGPKKLSDISVVIQNILKLLAPAAAIALLIMLLVGGFQFMTSGGDPKAAGQARATLTYAVIGVVLVVVSYLILKLIGSITGVDTTNVVVPVAP